MIKGILGRKIGMTQVFSYNGNPIVGFLFLLKDFYFFL